MSRMTLLPGLVGFLTVALSGCASQPGNLDLEQAHLGRGIVVGTTGAHLTQGSRLQPSQEHRVVIGQIQGLEGGAYVIEDETGKELRLPHDENTRIDRPAHIGDRIEAILDDSGRAQAIRNIDHVD